ncbi:hypothetical protein J1N35_005331 [Gossypium stocksii]|uniref:BED-type domain-containing protein n=1 Tax=Gossypium stocksii TaxID=47602 RepID=A0A9D3WDL5_9ROSI|nr:hypothetical protein J1N35_005331 [Gossypium stocksii]
MPPRKEFPTKRLEGAPSNDIGWHFGTPVPNAKGNIICKLCGKVVKGGITRFKEHIAHKTDNVAPCPIVTGVIRESMMNILKESNTKKIDKKRRKHEFLSQLREEEDEHEEFIDEIFAIRQATQEIVEEIRENYIVQIVTDNEAAMKAAGKKLMLKRKHLYWTSCAAHCLDLCLEDIGKRLSVAKVLDEAKKVTCFIYKYTWT